MIAKDGLVIAGGSWNALSATDLEPSLNGIEPGLGRRVLDRSAACALEETGFVDVAACLGDLRPTVGHAGGLRYFCDGICNTFPVSGIVSYEAIGEYEPISGRRPVAATFDLEVDNPVPSAESRFTNGAPPARSSW